MINQPFECFSRRAGIAIKILCALDALSATSVKEYYSATEVCHKASISVSYFEVLIKKMINAGWVRSRKGPYGGFLLVSDLSELSVYEIVTNINSNKPPCDAFVAALKDIYVNNLY
ncbi:TPA: Rrf2 family transcriptional regulator [Enterobacter hormaechei subsp. xiangfangensis]|nr:Rrf2 family transcriptional regulator [Enterobacter hormaechei subsp. xiangfangensis]HAV1890572.1 Rrf2 family transcriptional regulator [Enterobacter hormaechei subsp. xiangfangensis]